MEGHSLIPTPFLDLLLFSYAAYCSMGALKERDKDKLIQFMTYWIIFAALVTIEDFLYVFLKFVPLYTTARRVFCIWCVLPIEKNGGTIIYVNVVDRFYHGLEEEIQHISTISMQHAKRTKDQLSQRVGSGGGNTNVDNPSAGTVAEDSSSKGLEQLKDKAEAYRNQVLEQLLDALCFPASHAAAPLAGGAARDRGLKAYPLYLQPTPHPPALLPPPSPPGTPSRASRKPCATTPHYRGTACFYRNDYSDYSSCSPFFSHSHARARSYRACPKPYAFYSGEGDDTTEDSAIVDDLPWN